MDKIIERQLRSLDKKEERALRRGNKSILGKAIGNVDDKIPPALRDKLKAAFYQGFKLVFSKGTGLIEKTYNKEKLKSDYEIMDFIFHKNQKKRALKSLKKQSLLKQSANMGLTALEGTFLGVFGIGLPDIPIFIGVLLKGIYETALGYGFAYDTEEERYYILLMIEAALSGTEKEALNEKVDFAAARADRMESSVLENLGLEEQMKRTAGALAADMLCVKFVQGLPVVGAAGGVANVVYYNKIMDYVRLKYQKRYLLLKSVDKTKE